MIHFNNKNNQIKIISGKWKGRIIPINQKTLIRPTTSRIKETLFNWLNPVILNATCLDCFAGSGALGLEALSRGAKKTTFIDINYLCSSKIHYLIQLLQEYKSEVIHTNCLHWLKKSNNSYDIIFIDPPFYNYKIISKTILLIEKYNKCNKDAWIYIERSNQIDIFNCQKLPKNWFLHREKITKHIACHLYHRTA